MKAKRSAALQLLDILWNHRQESTGHSWLRMNQGMRSGLFLAVEMGLAFGVKDFETMQNFRIGYWAGDLEMFYRTAVIYRNASAWQAYEDYRGRKPFIWTPAEVQGREGCGASFRGEQPARLCVGARFAWKGERVTVTSFTEGEEPYLTACSYSSTDGDTCKECGHQTTWPREKIFHRFKISHEDLRAAKKERRVA